MELLKDYFAFIAQREDTALNKELKEAFEEYPYSDIFLRYYKEYQTFIKTLNLNDDRDINSEATKLFKFLNHNNMTIKQLVAKKQGKDYLFSQLKYALELADYYFQKFLYPKYLEEAYDYYDPSEIEIYLNDMQRADGLTGELSNLQSFMEYFLKQWHQFFEGIYNLISQICDIGCCKVSFDKAINMEIEYYTSFKKDYYNNIDDTDNLYDGKNKNLYKNLYIFCLLSYLYDFYLSNIPDVNMKTFLNDYNFQSNSNVNNGLNLNSYILKDIPNISIETFNTISRISIPENNQYSLKNVAEAYASLFNDDTSKVYKRIEKYFAETKIFKPSVSGEYKFDDVMLPISAHLFFKKKNVVYDPDDSSITSNINIWHRLYYPLFKMYLQKREDVIVAYSKYRWFILEEFKDILKEVDDAHFMLFLNELIGKSALRIQLRLSGKDELANRV